MQEKIAVLEWWHVVIIILTLFACVMIIIWFLSKLKSVDLSVGGVKFKKDNTSDVPHVNCPHRFSLGLTHTALSDISIKIHDIRSRLILTEQMHKAEEYLLQIKDFALTAAGSAIKDAIGSKRSAIAHSDYLNFKMVLQEYNVRLKDVVRAACINNGFSQMDQLEYKAYMEKFHIRIEKMAQRFFEENLILTSTTVDRIFEKKDLTEMSNVINKMFEDLSIIANANYLKIVKLEKQREWIAQHSWGIKYAEDIEKTEEKEG
jgi:hypothetical protein